MLDIGWLELVVIGIVALIVVGPKDLPMMFRQAGQFMAKARAMAREFQRSMEDAAKESGLSDSAKQLGQLNSSLNTKLNLNSATKAARSYADKIVKDGEETIASTPADQAVATTGAAAPKTTPPTTPPAAAVAPARTTTPSTTRQPGGAKATSAVKPAAPATSPAVDTPRAPAPEPATEDAAGTRS